MNLQDKVFHFEFSISEVNLLQMFFAQFIPKLGAGEWKDRMQSLEKRFDRAVEDCDLTNLSF